jgi:tetratricopeptide (TPR) repeat protein
MAQLPITQISQYEAVRLFIERARAVRADFTITTTNAPVVAEICWRLDGLPLAIELAAARIRLFNPDALLARLESRLKLLTGGPRDLPARQQTLQRAISWSYALLTETEQPFFRQLGVFVGGWSLAGAIAIGQHDEMKTLDLLTALLDKSLIKQIDGPDGEPRFTMLETIREYALDRLDASGEHADLQERHAAYLLALVEEVAPHLRGPRKDRWCDLLTMEHDNLRVVLGRFIAQGDAAQLARMCIAIWRFWWVRGHWREGREWLEKALALLPTQVTSETETRLRATILVGLVWMTIGMSDFAVALPLAEESLALFAGITDILGTGDAWFGVAHTTYGLSDLPRTRSALVHAHAHYRAAGDLSNTAYIQHLIGYMQYLHGEFADAQASQEEALSLAQAIDDQGGIAMALNTLGMLAAARCEYGVAEELITEALRLNRALNHRFEISGDLICLGLVVEMQGDYTRAEALQREGIEQRRSIGDRRGMVAAMANLVRVLLWQGDLEQSHACCRDLLTMVKELNYRAGYCWYLTLMSYQSIAIQQYDRAIRLLGSAEALREAHAIPIELDERKLYDQAITTLHAAFDDQDFAQAWAEGRQFSLDQALAYAQA